MHGRWSPLQIACFLAGTVTSSGAIHATMVPDSKKMDMPYVVATTAKWVRDLGYERFCPHGDKGGVLQLLLDKVAKECRPEGQDWQILRQVSPTQPSEQRSSGECRLHSTWTCWNISGICQRQDPVFCSDNTLTIASVDDQTRSMNDSVREDSWTEIHKRDSSLGRTSPRSPSWSEIH